MLKTKLQTNTDTTCQKVYNLIKDRVGYENLIFPKPIPVQHLFTTTELYAACVSPYNEIYIAASHTGHELWHRLEESDFNYELVLIALYNALQPPATLPTTTELFKKHFGNTAAVGLFHPNIESFFEELNEVCKKEDELKKVDDVILIGGVA